MYSQAKLSLLLFHLLVLLLLCQVNQPIFAQEPEYNAEIALRPKNPGIAFMASMAVPGLGQMYSHEVGKGVTYNIVTTSLLISPYILNRLNANPTVAEVSIGTFLFLTGSVFYLIQLIDAPYAAERFNKRNGIVLGSFNVKLGMEFANYSPGDISPFGR